LAKRSHLYIMGQTNKNVVLLLCINEPKTVVLHPTLNIIREHRTQLDGAGRPACRPRVSFSQPLPMFVPSLSW
jgi:hypothetical protein